MALGDLVLGLFDHLAFEFLDATAFQADEMIVMLLLDFVARDPVVEASLRRQTGLDQQLHGPIDRRVADIRMRLANGLIEIFTRDMSLRLEEGGENQLALLRMLQLVLLEVETEGFDFDFMGHGGTISSLALPTSSSVEKTIPAQALLEDFFRPRREVIVEVLGENSDLSLQPTFEFIGAFALQAQ